MREYIKRTKKQKTETAKTTRTPTEALGTARLLERPWLGRVGDVDPFDAFPIRMEAYMMNLLDFYSTAGSQALYLIESQTAYDPIKSYWLPLAFGHAALLHSVIACAAAIASGSFHDRLAVFHLNAAIRLLNRDLEGTSSRATSDANIAVVCTVAMIEENTGYHQNWRIHMKGLRELVQLRGGLNAFISSPLILNKIQRADLCGCIETGERLYFSDDFSKFPHPHIGLDCGLSKALQTVICPNDRMTSLIARLAHTVQSLNQLCEGDDTINPTAVRTALTFLQYDMLSLECDSILSKMLRTALLQLLWTIAEKLPHKSAFGTGSNVLQLRIKSLIEQTQNEHIYCNDDGFNNFQLWVLLLAGCSTSNNPPLKNWYLSSIQSLGLSMDLCGRDWADVKGRVQSFFWVPRLYGNAFEMVWNEANCFEKHATVLPLLPK
ncbi:hypothetical protein ASPZODRAFT_1169293 [Penicilliopsis zonata CBS 506.65]|uniref:Transcription factor domain-containing protein n=1 Tax=Penicilliopsis zonata CBS 506.65 TaxID=1073090 RepID=A0A1L9STG8_9EURO|nr:hypothetical protein ASPZODRAFT_1169293 [Penicilliopsis zonata CBS 506.65]OJJ50414.1 hypothetical protein ASPZODRAFT_1169293 [Penicilliopsis zonata CBS 506.65]